MVRAVLGSVLLLVGLPLLLAGGALWFAMQHRDAGGSFSASLAEISTDGYAVVASDVDAMLRRDVPFARGGRTTLRVTAHSDAGPAFVGLAPAAEVARYLADVPYAQVSEVQLARGPLPVAVVPVAGTGAPEGPPHAQPFWLAASGAGSLEWVPSETRGKQLALVVMDREGQAPLTVELAAEVRPQWLSSTTFGSLVLGTVLVLVAIAALAWPARPREVVYVVPPAQVPEIAAHLGVPVPSGDFAARWSLDPVPAVLPVPAPAPAVPEPAPAVPEPAPAVPEPAPAVPEPAPAVPVPAPAVPPPAAVPPPEPASEPVPPDPRVDASPPQWPPPGPSRTTAVPVPAPAPAVEWIDGEDQLTVAEASS